MEDKPFDCSLIALEHGFIDREAVKQAALMQREVDTVRDSVTHIIAYHNDEIPVQRISRMVQKEIHRLYINDGAAGMLLPSFLKRVRNNIIVQKNLGDI